MGIRVKYIKRPFHLAFPPSPWPLKHRIERARITCYLRRIFLWGFWFNEGFPSSILFLKMHERGLKSQSILFPSGVSWNEGQDLLSASYSLARRSSPEKGLAITQIYPSAMTCPTTPPCVNEITRHALYSHTGKHQEKDVRMNKYSTWRFSVLVSYKFSCNKLHCLTVKMLSVFSQSGGKLMLWHPIPHRFPQGVQELCLKSYRAMWVMWTPCSGTIPTWNTDCSIKVFRFFFCEV